jgi:hypothetical protein
MSFADVLAVPYTTSGAYFAPALPPLMAAGLSRYPVERAAIGAPRWHIDYKGDRYVVVLSPASDLPCYDVVPTKPGLRYALGIADALNRAYGIDPVAGYDVSRNLFG